MLVLEHLKQLVKACKPKDETEWLEFWSSIKPVKFGNTILWEGAAQFGLASYQVPRDSFNIVLRVETYTTNPTAGATDYGLYEPPPSGTAFWQLAAPSLLSVYPVTDPNAPVQLLLDSDEFLIFSGGYTVQLIGDFNAPPDSDDREVRTLVYSYDCSALIVDRIGSNQVIVPPSV